MILRPHDGRPRARSRVDRGLFRVVQVLRALTALALVGMIVWIWRTPGPRARVADFLDQASRAPDEPLAETVQVLGGPAGTTARAHAGDLDAACALAVARLFGARCGRPVPRRLGPRWAAEVAACPARWTPVEIACWSESDCPTYPRAVDCGP